MIFRWVYAYHVLKLSLAPIVWLAAVNFPVIASPKKQNLCLSGAMSTLFIYIDSTVSDVVVLTADGRELSVSRNLLLCPTDEVETAYFVEGIGGAEALVAARPQQALAMAAVREGLVQVVESGFGSR